MGKPNLMDRAIASIAPTYAVKRLAARQALTFLNSGYGNYGANLHKKNLLGWNFRGGSSKEDIEDNIDVLRQRSRDAYMGIPTATAALKTMRTNVVAGGLMPAPQIDGDFLGLSAEETERIQAQILREFSLWAEDSTCDADGIDDFYSLQQLAFLSFCMNGDAFATLGYKTWSWQPYGLRVRVIEADRVCSPNGHDWLTPGEVEGVKVHRIVQGVETNEDGMVVAYWVRNRHPLSSAANMTGGVQWTRVEARGAESGRRNMLHLIARERAGQVRGVPMLAPVLELFKQMGRYTEAEITAAVISAMFTVFVESETASDGRPIGEAVPEEQRLDDMDQGSIELGNGSVVSLNPGEKANFVDPKHPATGYDAFTDATIKMAASALEIPPEVLEKKFTTSYSAARGALNEFWRVCGMQRDWFVSKFCQPIYEEWLAEAVALGRVKARGFFEDPAIRKAYTQCNWNGPARTNLDPVREVKAAIERVNAGFSTAQEETQQMTGGNYARNIERRIIEAVQKKQVDDIMAEKGGSEGG